MKKNDFLFFLLLLICSGISAQDWRGIPVPANAGNGKTWQLQSNVSDSFNYVSDAGNRPSAFTSKWRPNYVNGWTGPGATIFNENQSWTNGSQLGIQAQPAGNGRSYNGVISSKNYIQYPVYMEIRAKIMDQVLANAFWTITDDQTQEIDIMEGYGSDRGGTYFSQRMHLSHHVFIRQPFQDYQPKDQGSWYYNGGRPWRADYHRYGCYWKDPWTLEYYIDGRKVRTVSGRNQIDPQNFTRGTGLNQRTRIVIDCENQTAWRPAATQQELADNSKNIFWVDWIRVYKPVNANGGGDDRDDDSDGGGNGTISNLAAGKPSFQSSTFRDNDNRFGSGKSVDGNTSNFNHTKKDNRAWWEVDLGFEADIGDVQIWNRADCCRDRLQNFDIKVYNRRGGREIKSVRVSETARRGKAYNVRARGRVVRIQLRGTNYLHMAEVRVNGTRVGSRLLSDNDFEGDLNTNISLFPNPANDHITIQGMDKGNYELIMHNMLGVRVLKQSFSADQNYTLDTSSLSNGLYIVSIKGEATEITRRIAIRR